VGRTEVGETGPPQDPHLSWKSSDI
jgi:hypothetical protein